jgi:Flp pilus assembly protein TadB
MKFIQIFGKTPNYKKFAFTPRFYNPEEEERQQRESRIRKELKEAGQEEKVVEEGYSYRQRISGSFRVAKKTATVQSDSSATMLRLVILLILAVGLIGFLQWGMTAIYVMALIYVPVYLYSKFRNLRKKNPD